MEREVETIFDIEEPKVEKGNNLSLKTTCLLAEILKEAKSKHKKHFWLELYLRNAHFIEWDSNLCVL